MTCCSSRLFGHPAVATPRPASKPGGRPMPGLSSVAGMRTLNAGDVALGASPRRQHRSGNARAGSARARVRLLPSPAGPGPFIAEVRIITSGKRAGHAGRFRRGGPDGAARVRYLVWAGYVVTAGDVRGELDSMVAGWGRGGPAHLMRWRRRQKS